MPVHYGKGSVIAMRQALAPTAIGVDIGCGMPGARTNLVAGDLTDEVSWVPSVVLLPPPKWTADDGARRRSACAQVASPAWPDLEELW